MSSGPDRPLTKVESFTLGVEFVGGVTGGSGVGVTGDEEPPPQFTRKIANKSTHIFFITLPKHLHEMQSREEKWALD